MKKLKNLLLVGIGLGIGVGLYFYWQYTDAHPASDDSYLQAGILAIAPQVGGAVATVNVVENQKVQRGDILFTIDTVALQAAQQAATAQLDQAKQQEIASAANIIAATAQLVSATAAQTEAQRDFDRQAPLAKAGTISSATMDQARSALDAADAGVQSAKAAIDVARAQHGGDGKLNAGVRAAEANLTLANTNLAYATVMAPTSGWVSNIDLRVGQILAAGQSQFSIVADDGWWIEANFKETDLTRIRPGMPATISVDMYPSVTLNGTVGSIGAGSGASFSLLPAQNATGNWVKVTQRFPVRIDLSDAPSDPALQLRVGASTTVTIDTTKGTK